MPFSSWYLRRSIQFQSLLIVLVILTSYFKAKLKGSARAINNYARKNTEENARNIPYSKS